MRVGWGFTPHCPFYSAGITYLGATQPHSLTRLGTARLRVSHAYLYPCTEVGVQAHQSPCVLVLVAHIKQCAF